MEFPTDEDIEGWPIAVQNMRNADSEQPVLEDVPEVDVQEDVPAVDVLEDVVAEDAVDVPEVDVPADVVNQQLPEEGFEIPYVAGLRRTNGR